MGRFTIDSKYGLPRVFSGRKFTNRRINESTIAVGWLSEVRLFVYSQFDLTTLIFDL